MQERSSYRVESVAAGVIAVAVCFAVGTSFVYSLWPVAAVCTVLFATGLWIAGEWVAGNIRFLFSPLLLLLAFLPLWGALQLFTGRSVYPFGTLLTVVLLSGAACCFWICTEAFQSDQVFRAFHQFLVVLGIAMSVLALVQMLTSNDEIYWFIRAPTGVRPLASFLNRDRYAAFIELLLPMVVCGALGGGKRWAVYAAGAGVMYASVIAGGSRAGMILCTLEVLLVISVLAWRGAFRRTGFRAAAVLVVVCAALATAVGWSYVMRRFTSERVVYRREFLISSIQMFRERPWMGFGLGSWPSVYPRFAIIDPGRFVNHAHDDWAEWAADGGLPFVLGWAVVAALAARRALAAPEALGVFTVFLHSGVDFNFQSWPIVLLVAVLLASSQAEANCAPT